MRAHLRRPGSLKGGDVPRHQRPGPCALHNCAAISPGPRPAPRRDRRQGATTHQPSGRARVPGRADAPADLVGTFGRARPHSGTWTGFCRRSMYRRTVLKSPARWPRCVESFRLPDAKSATRTYGNDAHSRRSTVRCTTGSCNDFLACWTHDSRYFLRQEPRDTRYRCCRVAWHPAGFTS